MHKRRVYFIKKVPPKYTKYSQVNSTLHRKWSNDALKYESQFYVTYIKNCVITKEKSARNPTNLTHDFRPIILTETWSEFMLYQFSSQCVSSIDLECCWFLLLWLLTALLCSAVQSTHLPEYKASRFLATSVHLHN